MKSGRYFIPHFLNKLHHKNIPLIRNVSRITDSKRDTHLHFCITFNEENCQMRSRQYITKIYVRIALGKDNHVREPHPVKGEPCRREH